MAIDHPRSTPPGTGVAGGASGSARGGSGGGGGPPGGSGGRGGPGGRGVRLAGQVRVIAFNTRAFFLNYASECGCPASLCATRWVFDC